MKHAAQVLRRAKREVQAVSEDWSATELIRKYDWFVDEAIRRTVRAASELMKADSAARDVLSAHPRQRHATEFRAVVDVVRLFLLLDDLGVIEYGKPIDPELTTAITTIVGRSAKQQIAAAVAELCGGRLAAEVEAFTNEEAHRGR